MFKYNSFFLFLKANYFKLSFLDPNCYIYLDSIIGTHTSKVTQQGSTSPNPEAATIFCEEVHFDVW